MISGRRATLALGIALLLSLGVNFFLGGLLLSRPESRGGFAEKLSEQDRDLIKKEFDSRREPIETGRTRLRQASEKVRIALRAAPFDRAALETALAEMRQANADFRATTHQALAAAAAQVTADGRVQMAEAPFLRRGERNRDRRN